MGSPPLGTPQADFTPWNSCSGRSSGQPTTLDCSGNAGMVAGGAEFIKNGCIAAGSGLGIVKNAGKRPEKKKKKKRKNGGLATIGEKGFWVCLRVNHAV